VPTYSHVFVAKLARDKKLLRNYSQNIDGLEVLAGMSADDLVECHGHFRSSSCVSCYTQANHELVVESIIEKGEPATCHVCDSFVKPDIVFFGEGLPARFHRLLQPDLEKADLCIVIGTSLQVAVSYKLLLIVVCGFIFSLYSSHPLLYLSLLAREYDSRHGVLSNCFD
jgi:NAD-dependent SIR2 family protein deacetylase